MITGQTIYVDGGYSIIGVPDVSGGPEAPAWAPPSRAGSPASPRGHAIWWVAGPHVH